MRKEAGLELTGRIVVELGPGDGDLSDFGEWIAAETLAVDVRAGDATSVAKA
jgi:hypothetical protein